MGDKASTAINRMIKEVRERIQFLVTVEIFFSTLVYGFYRASAASELISNNNASTWGIGVAFCILNYLLVSFLRNKSESIFKWILRSISLNILFFIIPIFVFIFTQHEAISGYWEWPFRISLWGTFVMPPITFLIIFFALSLSQRRKKVNG